MSRRGTGGATPYRGLLAVLGGTVGGQLIGFASAPILSRLYSPRDFGIFTVVFALTAVVGTVAAGRFELAVPLPRKERDAHSLVALGLLAAGGSALVGSAVVALFGHRLSAGLHRPELMPWLWFVPPTAALLAGFALLNALAVRHRRYAAIGRRSVGQWIVLAGTQIAGGLGGLRPAGLMTGMLVGQAAGLASLLPGAGLRSGAAREGRRRPHLAAALRRYRRFVLILAVSGLLNVLGLHLPVVLLSYAYGTEAAGWLGLTQRVLAAPVTVIGATVAQVYLGELTALHRSGSARAAAMFDRASRQLVVIGTLVALAVLLLGPPAFGWVFGGAWRTSGVYAQALAVGLAAQLVAAPLSQTLIAYERTHLQLAWDLGRLLLTGGAVAVCALVGGSAEAAVWTLGIGLAVSYLASWLLSRHVVHRSPAPQPEDRSRDAAPSPPLRA